MLLTAWFANEHQINKSRQYRSSFAKAHVWRDPRDGRCIVELECDPEEIPLGPIVERNHIPRKSILMPTSRTNRQEADGQDYYYRMNSALQVTRKRARSITSPVSAKRLRQRSSYLLTTPVYARQREDLPPWAFGNKTPSPPMSPAQGEKESLPLAHPPAGMPGVLPITLTQPESFRSAIPALTIRSKSTAQTAPTARFVHSDRKPRLRTNITNPPKLGSRTLSPLLKDSSSKQVKRLLFYWTATLRPQTYYSTTFYT